MSANKRQSILDDYEEYINLSWYQFSRKIHLKHKMSIGIMTEYVILLQDVAKIEKALESITKSK